MEQVTGLAWLTGHTWDQPRIQRGPSDPNAGMHAAFAMLVGLAEREVTGEGCQLEVTMVEGALNAAAELVIEYTAYGPIPTSVHYLEDVAGEAEQRLKERARQYQSEGVTVEAVCREGFPPDVIVEEAAQHNADLVAMGTHGRSGLAHLLLGSTAERVVQKSPCPVMTMRRPPEEDEG